MLRRAIALSAAVLLAACQPGAASRPADAFPAAKPNAGREVRTDNDLYAFEYFYPAEPGAIPALRRLLDDDLDTRRAGLRAMAEDAHHMAGEEGMIYRPYGLWVGWGVVSDLPGWISLSASISDYYGGAHPNHGFDAILWDKAAGMRRDVVDLFASRKALSDAMRMEFCRLLDLERAARRGKPPEPGSDDPFEECIDPLDSTVILESSDGRRFDRIMVLVAPYRAGPYVEGSYGVALPVSPAVLELVRPEYRRYFAVAR